MNFKRSIFVTSKRKFDVRICFKSKYLQNYLPMPYMLVHLFSADIITSLQSYRVFITTYLYTEKKFVLKLMLLKK